MTAGEHFGKAYKLCSKKQINAVYVSGKVVKSYPINCHYLPLSLDAAVPFQVVIAVPKRAFKRAHDRNYIKRLLREVIRKNKQLIEPKLQANATQLGIMVFYRSKEIPNYEQLDQAWQKLVQKLTQELDFGAVNNES
ncbi:MAG: ribonuclease P protein component [Fluviicola sp.]|jgi:ribonuclease P protein component